MLRPILFCYSDNRSRPSNIAPLGQGISSLFRTSRFDCTTVSFWFLLGSTQVVTLMETLSPLTLTTWSMKPSLRSLRASSISAAGSAKSIAEETVKCYRIKLSSRTEGTRHMAVLLLTGYTVTNAADKRWVEFLNKVAVDALQLLIHWLVVEDEAAFLMSHCKRRKQWVHSWKGLRRRVKKKRKVKKTTQ